MLTSDLVLDRHNIPERVERLTGMPMRTLVQQFESLGCDCEFGIMQRRCGAEPLGLLRFAYMRIDIAARGIRCEFEGVDDPQRLRPIARDGTEWDMHQATYNMLWHTFLLTKDVLEAELIRKQVQYLRFLRNKLLRDITEGEKTFVVWRTDKNLSLDEVTPLHDAIRAKGPAHLLFVTKDGSRAGSVTEIEPGLLHGRVGAWTRVTGKNDLFTNCGDWLAVLLNAWVLRHGMWRYITAQAESRP